MWDKATFSTYLPFSCLSILNQCLQSRTFISVTWATNQVPDSGAAAKPGGFELKRKKKTLWYSAVDECECMREALYRALFPTAAGGGGCSKCEAHWEPFCIHSSPCRRIVSLLACCLCQCPILLHDLLLLHMPCSSVVFIIISGRGTHFSNSIWGVFAWYSLGYFVCAFSFCVFFQRWHSAACEWNSNACFRCFPQCRQLEWLAWLALAQPPPPASPPWTLAAVATTSTACWRATPLGLWTASLELRPWKSHVKPPHPTHLAPALPHSNIRALSSL